MGANCCSVSDSITGVRDGVDDLGSVSGGAADGLSSSPNARRHERGMRVAGGLIMRPAEVDSNTSTTDFAAGEPHRNTRGSDPIEYRHSHHGEVKDYREQQRQLSSSPSPLSSPTRAAMSSPPPLVPHTSGSSAKQRTALQQQSLSLLTTNSHLQTLQAHLPPSLQAKEWRVVYSTEQHGWSIGAAQQRCVHLFAPLSAPLPVQPTTTTTTPSSTATLNVVPAQSPVTLASSKTRVIASASVAMPQALSHPSVPLERRTKQGQRTMSGGTASSAARLIVAPRVLPRPAILLLRTTVTTSAPAALAAASASKSRGTRSSRSATSASPPSCGLGSSSSSGGGGEPLFQLCFGLYFSYPPLPGVDRTYYSRDDCFIFTFFIPYTASTAAVTAPLASASARDAFHEWPASTTVSLTAATAAAAAATARWWEGSEEEAHTVSASSSSPSTDQKEETRDAHGGAMMATATGNSRTDGASIFSPRAASDEEEGAAQGPEVATAQCNCVDALGKENVVRMSESVVVTRSFHSDRGSARNALGLRASPESDSVLKYESSQETPLPSSHSKRGKKGTAGGGGGGGSTRSALTSSAKAALRGLIPHSASKRRPESRSSRANTEINERSTERSMGSRSRDGHLLPRGDSDDLPSSVRIGEGPGGTPGVTGDTVLMGSGGVRNSLAASLDVPPPHRHSTRSNSRSSAHSSSRSGVASSSSSSTTHSRSHSAPVSHHASSRRHSRPPQQPPLLSATSAEDDPHAPFADEDEQVLGQLEYYQQILEAQARSQQQSVLTAPLSALSLTMGMHSSNARRSTHAAEMNGTAPASAAAVAPATAGAAVLTESGLSGVADGMSSVLRVPSTSAVSEPSSASPAQGNTAVAGGEEEDEDEAEEKTHSERSSKALSSAAVNTVKVVAAVDTAAEAAKRASPDADVSTSAGQHTFGDSGANGTHSKLTELRVQRLLRQDNDQSVPISLSPPPLSPLSLADVEIRFAPSHSGRAVTGAGDAATTARSALTKDKPQVPAEGTTSSHAAHQHSVLPVFVPPPGTPTRRCPPLLAGDDVDDWSPTVAPGERTLSPHAPESPPGRGRSSAPAHSSHSSVQTSSAVLTTERAQPWPPQQSPTPPRLQLLLLPTPSTDADVDENTVSQRHAEHAPLSPSDDVVREGGGNNEHIMAGGHGFAESTLSVSATTMTFASPRESATREYGDVYSPHQRHRRASSFSLQRYSSVGGHRHDRVGSPSQRFLDAPRGHRHARTLSTNDAEALLWRQNTNTGATNSMSFGLPGSSLTPLSRLSSLTSTLSHGVLSEQSGHSSANERRRQQRLHRVVAEQAASAYASSQQQQTKPQPPSPSPSSSRMNGEQGPAGGGGGGSDSPAAPQTETVRAAACDSAALLTALRVFELPDFKGHHHQQRNGSAQPLRQRDRKQKGWRFGGGGGNSSHASSTREEAVGPHSVDPVAAAEAEAGAAPVSISVSSTGDGSFSIWLSVRTVEKANTKSSKSKAAAAETTTTTASSTLGTATTTTTTSSNSNTATPTVEHLPVLAVSKDRGLVCHMESMLFQPKNAQKRFLKKRGARRSDQHSPPVDVLRTTVSAVQLCTVDTPSSLPKS